MSTNTNQLEQSLNGYMTRSSEITTESSPYYACSLCSAMWLKKRRVMMGVKLEA